MTGEPSSFEGVLEFWFDKLDSKGFAPREFRARWFGGGPDFDRAIHERYSALHADIASGGHREWLSSARGRLALVIVLDQFTRNLFRNSAQMFACDGRALELALGGIELGEDRQLGVDERAFLYMPLMHSEKLAVQERCVDLFATLRDEQSEEARERAEVYADFARRHRDIVRRFGRFPHRNALLGRSSTPEELEFLKEPGSSF